MQVDEQEVEMQLLELWLMDGQEGTDVASQKLGTQGRGSPNQKSHVTSEIFPLAPSLPDTDGI
jgi:hypothetical protein